MDINQFIGYGLAVIVGITLGLIGSGGSILSVPILVYIMGIEPILATAYSLFIVGITALLGGIQKAKENLVDFKKVILFGTPTIIAVFITRKLILPSIPDIVFESNSFSLKKSVLVMIIFAIVMIVASTKMIKPLKEQQTETTKINYFNIFLFGSLIGIIAGFVGAGGGFLIIPALLFLTKTPMKMAVGTSLFIVASQSLIGFLGDLKVHPDIDWRLIMLFSTCSIVGVLIGNHLSKKISGDRLKKGFGWFVLCMGIYILTKELLFK